MIICNLNKIIRRTNILVRIGYVWPILVILLDSLYLFIIMEILGNRGNYDLSFIPYYAEGLRGVGRGVSFNSKKNDTGKQTSVKKSGRIRLRSKQVGLD